MSELPPLTAGDVLERLLKLAKIVSKLDRRVYNLELSILKLQDDYMKDAKENDSVS